jgi:regulator of PEP synthase PpsR (kinase-PPPase family)
MRPGSNKSQRTTKSVFILSDSTGNLARHVLTAVRTQFPRDSIVERYENFIRNDDRLTRILTEARDAKAAICHAIVSIDLKARIAAFCTEANLPCFDLTGGLVKFLEAATGAKCASDLEVLHQLDEAYRRRIDAMEFTLSHDDGLGLETLNEADVVLAGVSRTSKTPTSILLAQQGYRAANVSLAKGVSPPAALLALPAQRVIALTINPDQLALIRAHRQVAWGMSQTDYGAPASVQAEIAWSRNLFRERGWRVLDVTDQAVEETAAKIASLIGSPAQGLSSIAASLPRSRSSLRPPSPQK